MMDLNKQYNEEAILLKNVKRWLEPQERNGIKLIRINDRYAKGYSDLFINARGRFVVAELKDITGTPSLHQELFIEEMQRCGAIGGICRSIQDVANLIDEALYCTCNCSVQQGITYFDECKYCSKCGKEIKMP